MLLSPHFSVAELTHTDTGLPNDPTVVEGANLVVLAEKLLEPIRELLAVLMLIHSGFRSLEVNRRVGGDPKSAHLEGRACDFHPGGDMTCREAFDKIRNSSVPYDKVLLEEHGGRFWIHVQIARAGAQPRGLAYIAQVTDSGTAYRLVPRG